MGLLRRRHDHDLERARLERVRPRAARRGNWQRYELAALRAPLPSTTSSGIRPTLAEAGRSILARLEPQLREHVGAYVAVDVDSEKWLVGKTITELLKQVRARLPGRRVYLSRVGESYVFQLRR